MSFEMIGVAAMIDAFDDITDAMSFRGGWVIGTNVRYAQFQEFGTSYQSGTPHLRPGFDEVVAMHVSRIVANNDDAETIVKEVAQLIERKTKTRAPVDTGNLRASYRAERM